MNNEYVKEDLIDLVTSENVRLQLQPAGIGSRGMAQLVDVLIQIAVVIVISLSIFIPNRFIIGDLSNMQFEEASKGVVVSIGLLVFFVVIWGYHVFFELLWNGQTPGKRWAGVRVVAEGGRPLTIYESALRNIVRIVDLLPNAYAVGIITMFLDKDGRRLGDIVAGTYVVKVEDNSLTGSYKTKFRKKRLPADTLQYIKQKSEGLTMEQANLVREYLEDRTQMDPSVRVDIGSKLVEKLLGLKITGRNNIRLIDQMLDALLVSFYERVS